MQLYDVYNNRAIKQHSLLFSTTPCTDTHSSLLLFSISIILSLIFSPYFASTLLSSLSLFSLPLSPLFSFLSLSSFLTWYKSMVLIERVEASRRNSTKARYLTSSSWSGNTTSLATQSRCIEHK